jgi:hypothetical protein
MPDTEQTQPPEGDALIDEVRSLRRTVCDQFGNDVDRLCNHLQDIEREYRERTGRFADVPRALDRELFPEAAIPKPDPLIEDVRQLKDPKASKETQTGT